MKISIKIGIDGSGLAHALFYRGGKKVQWQDLAVEEQSNILKATSQMWNLFDRFAPLHCKECDKLFKRSDPEGDNFCSAECEDKYSLF